jgi:hypothetical protein
VTRATLPSGFDITLVLPSDIQRWRKNWLRVAKQHKHASRKRIIKKMPDIGQLLPVDLGRKTRCCGPFFLKVS